MLLPTFNFPQAYTKAMEQAEQMLGNDLYSRFKLGRDKRLEKAMLGSVGELAFEHFLIENKIAYERDTSDFTQVRTDQFDFKIHGKLFDIKVAKLTTNKPPSDNWTYGYPVDQNPASKDFVVVGWVDMVGKRVGFHGYIRGGAIARYDPVTKNKFAGFDYLTPNHEFKWGVLNKDIEGLLTHYRK